MVKWILAAGAAALALSAPVLANQDKGNKGGQSARGGGNGGGGGGQKAERGNGGGGQKAERGGGGQERQAQRVERRDDDRQRRQAQRVERRDDDRQERRAQRVERREDRVVDRRIDRDDRRELRAERRDDRRDIRVVNGNDRDLRRDDDRRFDPSDFGRRFARFESECPPGLAKKGNGCLPPGQAKKMVGALLPAALGSQLLDGPYRQWYRDDERYLYRNDGDYIYRVDRQGGIVDALFPFQDRDYSYYDVGSVYPADYNFYNVPQQYQSFYPDSGDYNYRYGDGAIYQVDPSSSTISSIVALLAGDLGVGQQLPSSYGVYNVPMAYRDRYYDTPEATYRYNDGYIYQADPKTQLITAVIDALV